MRMYVEQYTKDETQYAKETSEGLKGLIQVAMKISRLDEFLGRDQPTVITVSGFAYSLLDVVEANLIPFKV